MFAERLYQVAFNPSDIFTTEGWQRKYTHPEGRFNRSIPWLFLKISHFDILTSDKKIGRHDF